MSIQQREDVPSSAGGDDEEMLDDEQAQALTTTEPQEQAHLQWENDVVLSPKRRKVDQPNSDVRVAETVASPRKSAFRPQQTPSSTGQRSAPRFAPPQGSPAPTMLEHGLQQRPPFLRPAPAPQEPSEPLPEAFSPHRRGTKFVPGGMASTLQQWVIEAGQAAVQSRKAHVHLRGDDFVTKVRLEEVVGEGPYTAKARGRNGQQVNLLLAHSIASAGSNVRELSVGNVIGVRAPSWDVEIDGRNWTVGVDWSLVS